MISREKVGKVNNAANETSAEPSTIALERLDTKDAI